MDRNSSRHGLLAQNNEYADEGLLFPDGVANWNAEKTEKSLNAHGVSIVEIRKGRRDDHDHDRDRRHRHWRDVWDWKDSDWHVVRRSSTRAASPDRRRCGWAVRRRATIG